MINVLRGRKGPLFSEVVFVPRTSGPGYEEATVIGDLQTGQLVRKDGTQIEGMFSFVSSTGDHGIPTRTLLFTPNNGNGEGIIVRDDGLTSSHRERKG